MYRAKEIERERERGREILGMAGMTRHSDKNVEYIKKGWFFEREWMETWKDPSGACVYIPRSSVRSKRELFVPWKGCLKRKEDQ